MRTDPLLTAADAARRLALTRSAFWKLVYRGRIHREATEPHVPVFRQSEVDRYAQEKAASAAQRTYITRTCACIACGAAITQTNIGRTKERCAACHRIRRRKGAA